MKETYVRTEQVQDVIKDIKLTVNAWKLLFALDGETEIEKLSLVLGMNNDEVNTSIQELSNTSLIEKTGQEEALEPAIEESLPDEPEIVDELISEAVIPEDSSIEPAEDILEEVELNAELDEDDLEQLLAESNDDKAPQLEMDVVEEEVASDEKEEAGEVALDDLVSQIVEQDDDLLSSDESAQELEELLAEGSPEHTPEISKDVETEEDEMEMELDESELIADLEKDIQDFMLDEDLGVEVDEPNEKTTEVDMDIETPTEELNDLDELDVLDEFNLEDIAAPEEATAPVVPEEKTEPAIDADRKTVLVVDDSVVIRKMIEIALENDPFNVIAAPTGKEALSKVDEEKISVIILDLILPDLNGLDVLKAVKASSDIPVIILTGKDAPKEIQKAKEQGADDFLTKPFKDEDLVSKVKELSV